MTAGGGYAQLWAPKAWLGAEQGVASDVLISCSPSGTITEVATGVPRTACHAAATIGGDICLPGFVNAHSHAFHRALRGLSEMSSGSFWTWRELAYHAAAGLNPDSYRELSSLVYAEMLLAGYTTVGEFHYVHHGAGGVPYDDPNEMGRSVMAGAAVAGIRLTLIDTCYLQGGVDGSPLAGVQLRFGDASGEAWSGRVSSLLADGSGDLVNFGVAAHSVRATPAPAIKTVAALAASESLPLHIHLSEQRRENEDCLKVTGLTPTDLLHDCGALTASTTAVHATHLTSRDLSRLGLARCGICACPTTERDLGDGIGPFPELVEAGAVLSIGSDSQAVIDPFEETRAIELNARLAAELRGIWRVTELFAAGTEGGSRALGWPAAGIRAGAPADVIGVSLDSLRLAGESAAPDGEELLARLIFAGSHDDVDTVVVGGRIVVKGGEHVALGPSRALTERLHTCLVAAFGDEP